MFHGENIVILEKNAQKSKELMISKCNVWYAMKNTAYLDQLKDFVFCVRDLIIKPFSFSARNLKF